MKHVERLQAMNACREAVEYASTFSTLQEAWVACERGDWLLWLVGRTTERRDEAALRRLTLAKARCAKLAVPLMRGERSRLAVEGKSVV